MMHDPTLPPAVLAAMATATAAGPLTPAERCALDNLHPRWVDQIDPAADDLADADDERLSLEHERKQALSLAAELAEIATSLRAVATGTASSLEITDVTGSVDGYGELRVGGTLDWGLLTRHARPESGR